MSTIQVVVVVLLISSAVAGIYSMRPRNLSIQADANPVAIGADLGTLSLGKYTGQVIYDDQEDYYSLDIGQARFAFKASPIEALEVLLEAPGQTKLEKNTSLLYGMLGKEVMKTTILINPEEWEEVMPAAADIERYINIVNRTKFGGLAYTKQTESPAVNSASILPVKTLEDATPGSPIIQLKGPKSGATTTRVSVIGDGKIVVEGETYEDLYKAADLICVTLLKMLCGSTDCPDAAACATGGSCGCSKR